MSSSEREPLRLVHHHPGRVRVRASVFLGAVDVFERVRDALADMPGVVEVTHGAASGSVLVSYEPGQGDLDAILDRIAWAANLGDVVDEVTARQHRADPAEGVARAVRSLDEAVRSLGHPRVGLGLLVPAALAATAVVSVAVSPRKELIPRWDNLLWWSYSIFRDWNSRAIVETSVEPESDES